MNDMPSQSGKLPTQNQQIEFAFVSFLNNMSLIKELFQNVFWSLKVVYCNSICILGYYTTTTLIFKKTKQQAVRAKSSIERHHAHL